MDFVVGDTHFDHRNIIEYCDRPYDSVTAMNEALVANWNSVVDDGDEVIFLGDLTMTDEFARFAELVDRLHGQLHFVLGDHDRSVVPSLERCELYGHFQFTYRDVPFYCVHDPADAPAGWDGWVLHGHHHNNWPDEFPFVNPDRRLVNASVELVDYTPLDLPTLVDCLQRFTRLEELPEDCR